MKNLRSLLAGAALACLAWSALAHGDEDHSEPRTAKTSQALAQAPRAEAQTDAFELVATLEQDRLVLTIDRFDTNEPVVGAQVEVDTGTEQVSAHPSSPGVYWIPQGGIGQPGRHPLTFTIETDDSADLLTATLEVPPPVAIAAATVEPARSMAWGLGGIALLAGVGLMARRRRTPSRTHSPRDIE
ncbi:MULTISPECIES: hypothetical protein [unclassified Simplicispira]|uniref:hypothetical protein n=1 Tax=unclassified Simplicispira TaxID=2630407 RepID=UPI000D5CB615|nr:MULTISPECIES: hypothetical protein [unclassified Simplicispira]PVY56323.1 hypothetical protein C8D04_1579 [Simplicispira sp. 125]REG17268.1 hypothetical protein C8D01_1889 [Simplicispira sp. 110]